MSESTHALPPDQIGPRHRIERPRLRPTQRGLRVAGAALGALVAVPGAIVATDSMRGNDMRASAAARQFERGAVVPEGLGAELQDQGAAPDVSPSAIPKIEIPRTAEQAKAEDELAAAVQEAAKSAVRYAAQNHDQATIETIHMDDGTAVFTIDRQGSTDGLDGQAQLQVSFTAPTVDGDPDLRAAPQSFTAKSTNTDGTVSRISYDIAENGAVVASLKVNGETGVCETPNGTQVPLEYDTSLWNGTSAFVLEGIRHDLGEFTAAPPVATETTPEAAITT